MTTSALRGDQRRELARPSAARLSVWDSPVVAVELQL
jgi:hypothetical protein